MTLQQKLLAAFDVEHREILARIRSNLNVFEGGDTASDSKHLEEAFRMAHTLKGAARVVDLTTVTQLAHGMESLFMQIRQGRVALDARVIAWIHAALDTVEDAVEALKSGRAPVDSAPALLAQVDGMLPASSSKLPQVDLPAPLSLQPTPQVMATEETLRLKASQLDRLVRTSGELSNASLNHALLLDDLKGLVQHSASIGRDWHALKQSASTQLRQLTENPEFQRLNRFLGSLETELQGLGKRANGTRKRHRRNSWELTRVAETLQRDVQLARTIPAENVFGGFHKLMRDLSGDSGKKLEFRAVGLEVEADRLVLQALKDPVMHLLRNSVAHGLEQPEQRKSSGKDSAGRITLSLVASKGRLNLTVEDDGGGLDTEKIARKAVELGLLDEATRERLPAEAIHQWIFHSGLSTANGVSEISGRGMGLSVVRDAVARLKGDLTVHSEEGKGIRFVLSVPMSLSSHRVLYLQCQGQTYGVPCFGIERLHRIDLKRVAQLEGRQVIEAGGRTVPLVGLPQLLGMKDGAIEGAGSMISVLVLRSGDRRLAVAVDQFQVEVEALVNEAPTRGLSGIAYLQGVSFREDGRAILILNPIELIEIHRKLGEAVSLRQAPARKIKARHRILVVDDSFTTRTLEKSILEASGYEVTLSVDGVDALAKLKSGPFDLVVSDVEMPQMNGFELLKQIKIDPSISATPVILVTSLDQSENREKGISGGAAAYIVKQRFDQSTLLSAIRSVL